MCTIQPRLLSKNRNFQLPTRMRCSEKFFVCPDKFKNGILPLQNPNGNFTSRFFLIDRSRHFVNVYLKKIITHRNVKKKYIRLYSRVLFYFLNKLICNSSKKYSCSLQQYLEVTLEV